MHQLLSSELLKSQESISQVCDRPCPFCHCDFERQNDSQQHVAGHLETIALLSLPNLDDVDETSEAGKANSNSANRHYVESKVGDFDNTEPLACLENEPLGSTPVVSEMEKLHFDTKLKAESISFESMNGLNVEDCQAYWSGIVGRWFGHVPLDLEEDGGTYSSEPKEQTRIDATSVRHCAVGISIRIDL